MLRRQVTPAPADGNSEFLIPNYELSVRAKLKGTACGFVTRACVGAAYLNGIGCTAAVCRIVDAVFGIALYSLIVFFRRITHVYHLALSMRRDGAL